jgi:hypothetical protein
MKQFVFALLVLGLCGCNGAPEEAFEGDRIPDACGSNWPVCQTFAGCRLDDGTFVQGSLPGTRKFIVHTNGPATIEVDMLVENAQAEGTKANLTFFEPACAQQYLVQTDGQSFFAESQNEAGTPFSRSHDVSNAGDHLVLLDCDATATYLLKVSVTEKNPPGE